MAWQAHAYGVASGMRGAGRYFALGICCLGGDGVSILGGTMRVQRVKVEFEAASPGRDGA